MSSRFASLTRIPSFVPLSAATLMLGVAMSFTAPYLSLFSIERTGMSPLQLGLFMTVIAASGVVASTWAGKWSDKHGHHRALLMASLAAAAIGFASICFVRSYWLLIVIGVLFLGSGGSALSLVFAFGRARLAARNDGERAFALATLRTVFSVAWVFGPSIGALVLAAAGFYGLFIFAAASFIACGVIVMRIRLAPAPLDGGVETPGTNASNPLPVDLARAVTAAQEASHEAAQLVAAQAGTDAAPESAAARSALWRAIAALTLLGLVSNATMIVLPLYIVHGMSGKQIDVSIMLGLGAFLEIPMMLALGARGATLNKLQWLAAAAAVHVAYFVAVAGAWSISVLIPVQALSACVVAVTSCLGMTYIQDLMPRSPGAATALFFNAARVGSILSGVLSGTLVGTVGYKGTFLCCGTLALIALWLFADPPWLTWPRRRAEGTPGRPRRLLSVSRPDRPDLYDGRGAGSALTTRLSRLGRLVRRR